MSNRCFFVLSAFVVALLGGGIVYCHIFDCEFVSPGDRFLADRENGYTGDFWDWINEQDAKEDRRDAWILDRFRDLGMEAAACFDPGFDAKCPEGRD